MGFLDRFKPQPRWKHPDPATRVAAVESLPDEEQDLLRGIALEDPDPSVRRAAIARLNDPALLATVARQDADESVRAEARELIVGLARDTGDADAARAALAGLTDSRELAIVARTAEVEAVALDALGKLQEPRVVAVVARQAIHSAVRMAALARLETREDLLAVAVKSEHKDVAVGALDRLHDREALDIVSVRGRNKVASRRARAALRALDEAARIPQQQAARRLQLCEGVERLQFTADLKHAEAQLASAESEWQELASGADTDIAARFDAAAAAIRQLLTRSEAERAEHEEQARRMSEEMAQATTSRLAICERVEGLVGETAAAGLDEARTLWVALAPWPEPLRESLEARQIEQRFARATAECERRISRQAELASRMTELEAVVQQAEAALAAENIGAVRAGLEPARRAWQKATAGLVVEGPLVDRMKAVDERYAGLDVAAREARAKDAAHNLERVERLAAESEKLAALEEPPIKDVERIAREVRAAIEHTGPLPTKQDHDRLVERLRAVQTALSPRLAELREAEDWRRWANATLQEELCVKAEALAGVTEPAEAAKQLRDLQQQWKKVGPAPREKADDLWKRFKSACDATRHRCEAYFADQRVAEAENLRRKELLCVQAEALADSTDWIKTADELKRLQAEWQSIGPVPHEQAKAVWQRFRTACDTFFTRRKDDLAQRKQVWGDNQKRKEAICARAEELAQSTDWDAAASELKRLQAEWKTVGPVKRQKSEALWARFRAACDTFFDRFKHRDQLQLSGQMEERDQLCQELETLVPTEGAPVDPTRVLDVWARWQQAVRLPRALGESLDARFDQGLARILESAGDRFKGTRLDLEANARRMEQLVTQVESLVAGQVTATDIAHAPPEALATLLKDALASNTIGGRVDEDAKRRAASAAIRDAQQQWRRLGPVPNDKGRQLTGRFHRACRRFFDQGGQPAPRGGQRQEVRG